MNRTCRHLGRSVVLTLLALTGAWGILATAAVAAELVPPRPLPNKPVGGTLNIAYFREVSSPDGFQATGSFDRWQWGDRSGHPCKSDEPLTPA
jgi:hypothetical protein